MRVRVCACVWQWLRLPAFGTAPACHPRTAPYRGITLPALSRPPPRLLCLVASQSLLDMVTLAAELDAVVDDRFEAHAMWVAYFEMLLTLVRA